MEHIKTLTEQLLKSLGVEAFTIEIEEIAGTKFFSITSEMDLAGVGGERIKALNMLVRRLMEKQGLDERFTIDANGYYKAEVAAIEVARAIAAEVVASKADKEMPSMRAFDRLVAHAALTGMPNIKTESTGEGRERRVVVKYYAI
jgi:spoIIIJ-associated protein